MRGVADQQVTSPEMSLQAAARATGYARQTLDAWASAGSIRVREERHGTRTFKFVRLDELEADMASFTTCTYPGCQAPAPGRSDRCRGHVGPVKYDAVDLTCQHCGESFVRAGSTLRETGFGGTRGTYCSNRCKGLAQAQRLPELNLAGAREHHQHVEQAIADEGLYSTRTAADYLGISEGWLRWGPRFRGRGLGQIRRFDGSPRLVFTRDELDGFEREWIRDAGAIAETWLDPEVAIRRREGQLEARGGVMTHAEAKQIRTRVDARRRRLKQRKAPGRSPKSKLRAALVEHARAALDETPELAAASANQLFLAAGERSWEAESEEWPRDVYPGGRSHFANVPGATAEPLIKKRVDELVGADLKRLQDEKRLQIAPGKSP